MKFKKIILTVLILSLLAFVSWEFLGATNNDRVHLEITKPSFNTLSKVITATGTIEPITQVEVGTQVSGKIDKVYVDFNDHVKKKQIIAEIDKTILQSNLKNAEAALQGAKIEAEYQEKIYKRTKTLYEKAFSSETDLELAEYNYNNAKIACEKTSLMYDIAKQDLSYAYIHSPIDGVVLDVSIEEGQTVAANYSAPTLFTIANDLTKMQVEASVDEADIGQVKSGQQVTFTVDAFPQDIFTGTVSQIRLNPTTSSNVVTYTVIIEAPNKDYKLMPGMTASITVITQKEENALTIPVKATRFSPETDLEPNRNTEEMHMIKPLENNQTSGNEKIVWIKNGIELQAKIITTGLSEGSKIQVLSGIDKNDEVVVGTTNEALTPPEDFATEQSSPFMPQRPGKK